MNEKFSQLLNFISAFFKNDKNRRPIIFLFAAIIHVFALFIVFKTESLSGEIPENARIMKLTDIDEAPPPPDPEVPQVESIAETMIETDEVPDQVVVDPGTLVVPVVVGEWDEYLPSYLISVPPKFDEREIRAALVYPLIARRSGIEGRVILELFIDRHGLVRNIRVLQENPKDRGFGEAAVKAFTGRRGTPAQVNGEPAATRYRYPVGFAIR